MKREVPLDIVILASTRWDSPYASAAFSLATALSVRHRVFYIDNPVSFTEYFRGRKSVAMKSRKSALLSGDGFFRLPDEENTNLITVTPLATYPVNWLPKGRLYDLADGVNQRRVAATLNKLFRIFGVKRYVLLNSFNPLFDGVQRWLDVKPEVSVYQCVDDIRYAPYLSKHGVYKEHRLMLQADFTIVTSSHLFDLKREVAEAIYMLPNAADTLLFSHAQKSELPKPQELLDVGNRKVICYVGNICQRLDYVLLKRLASAHPDKVIMMIGPEAKIYGDPRNTYADRSGLKKFPNVIFVGPRRQIELPAYLKHADVCIIPFLCNELTKSIYPLKMNEYLSAGKPVVTTSFSEDILGFKGVCYASENDVDFVSLIDQAILEDSPARAVDRITFSSSNNWEARARRFIELIVEFLKHDDRGSGQPDRRAGARTHHQFV